MDKNPNENNTPKDVTFLDLYNAFLIYQKILKRFDKGTIDDGSYFIGYVLITSLICEIGIKALLKNEGKNQIKEHKLDKLFNKLSHSQKQQIAKRCGYTFNEFKVQLLINSDHFVEWRYFYEGNCSSYHPFFIDNLINALSTELNDIVKNIKPEA